MKRTIVLVVNNFLNNDSRIFRHAQVINTKYNTILSAKSSKNIKTLFYKDTVEKYFVYRFINKYILYHLTDNQMNSIFYKFIWYVKYLYREIFNQYIIYKCLKKINCNIIISNDFDTILPSYLASKRKKIKIIYDSHELWIERNPPISKSFNIRKHIEYFIEWFLIKRVNAVITVSEGIAEELSKRYKIKKPYIIRNLDTIKPLINEEEKNNLRRKYNIPINSILIVYQGGLSDSRGIPELIEAMDKLDNNIHLLLMGNFLSQKNEILIRKNNRIHYIGMIPQEELHKYTCMGDIGIHPMRIDNILNHKLTLPNKFSQYMNAGLCLALYKTPDNEKLISKSKSGVVFESGSSDNIVKAINNIIESERLEEYKKNAREYFLKIFNWDIEKNKLLEIIDTVEKSS